MLLAALCQDNRVISKRGKSFDPETSENILKIYRFRCNTGEEFFTLLSRDTGILRNTQKVKQLSKEDKTMQVTVLNKIPVKIWAKSVDPHTWEEIENLSTLPFLFHHLAFMPDLHGGMGMPIGGVMATKGVIVPNAVGVDIGCGMCAVKTNWKVPDIPREVLTEKIMTGIRERIPVGFAHHEVAQDESFLPVGYDIDSLQVVKTQYEDAHYQVGTLGGGNHFIELQKDDEDTLWVMLHSGSRNLGYKVAEFYDKKAAAINAQYYSVVKPEIRMAFIPQATPLFGEYWNEMKYCIDFAFCNRRLMMERIQEVLSDALPGIVFEPMINIAHNYAAIEHHFGENVYVHRKGATRARKGEIGIIPGSQGTRSYIVEGLGNPDSFESSSHGSGRVLSRSAAVKELSLEDEIARLDSLGIIHAIRSRNDLEEAPGAYKDIDEVMECQKDLVKILTRLSPVAVVKGL